MSNVSFNALVAQIVTMNPMFRPGDTTFKAMPLFYGFGFTLFLEQGCFDKNPHKEGALR